MNPQTPEQKQQLESWVGQRDLILVDIGNKKTEQENLTKTNLELAESNTEIQNKIQQSIGRLEELDKKEKEATEIISTELSDSFVAKNTLEAKKEGLVNEIAALTETKNILVETTTLLKNAFDGVLDRINGLDQTIGNAVKINNENVRQIENMLTVAGAELQKIIDINSKNVEKTNVVINDLPRIIFDLQTDIIERKKFNRVKIS